jgi:hypothetical protein
MRIRHWAFSLLALSAIAAACSSKKTGGDDEETETGSGGAGSGQGGTSSVTAPAVGTGGSTQTVGPGPGSSTMGGCDTGQMGDINSMQCGACIQCASQTTCMAEFAKCGMGSECATYDQCRIDCITKCNTNGMPGIQMEEQMCFYTCHGDPMSMTPPADSCMGKFKQGAADWDAWITCVLGDCPSNCGTGGGNNTPICDSGFASSNKACADCLTAKCCTEFKTCFMDQNCQDCLIDKIQTACDASMNDEKANGCVQTNCAAECM